jgi:hypothetical protein
VTAAHKGAEQTAPRGPFRAIAGGRRQGRIVENELPEVAVPPKNCAGYRAVAFR